MSQEGPVDLGMATWVRRRVRWSGHGHGAPARLGALLLVAVALLLPRGLALDRLVTPDEHIWLSRSANFYYALVHGDLAGTYQYIHPGVTVMWVGAAAYALRFPTYPWEATGPRGQWSNSIQGFLQSHGYAPIDMLIAGRVALVVAIVTTLLVAYLVAGRVVGRAAALAGFLLIALDPFHIALSRVLHLDALTSSLMLLSLLALLSYLDHGRRRRDLVLSAVAAGLACLTRSLGFALIPFAGLLIAWLSWPGLRVGLRPWLVAVRAGLASYLVWLAVAGTLFVALWPAMWVDPVGVVRAMLDGATEAAETGHFLRIFFAGDVHEGDPSRLFYPITYLWRATPVTLLGLAVALAALALPDGRLLTPAQRRAVLALLLVALGFTLALSFGAKKFDRYLLPVYLLLDLVAAVGWLALAGWLGRGCRRWRPAALPLVLAVVVLAQGLQARAAHPYYFSYYNPALGGTTAAPEVMMVGWGEGMDQVADYLEAQPDATDLQVLTRAWSYSLSYLFAGRVVQSGLPAGQEGLREWVTSDYFLLYITERQRELVPPALLAYFAERAPVLTVRLQGLEYAWLYDIRQAPVPDYFLEGDARPLAWGDQVRLVVHSLAARELAPGQPLALTLYLQDGGARAATLVVRMRLVDGGGRVLLTDETQLPGGPPARAVWPLTIETAIPGGTRPGVYRIELRLDDLASGALPPATDVRAGRSLDEWVAIDEVVVE